MIIIAIIIIIIIIMRIVMIWTCFSANERVLKEMYVFTGWIFKQMQFGKSRIMEK